MVQLELEALINYGARWPPSTPVTARSPCYPRGTPDPAVAAAVAPADQLQAPLVPDGQQALGVAEEELQLGLAAPLDAARCEVFLLDQGEGDVGDGECDT